jgi:hypothetical protein
MTDIIRKGSSAGVAVGASAADGATNVPGGGAGVPAGPVDGVEVQAARMRVIAHAATLMLRATLD